MRPHLRVHGGRDEHRPVGRKQDRGGEIVGKAVRHLGEEVGGRRGDDDDVGLACEPDVADRVLFVGVEEFVEDRLAGDRGNGKRRYEMMRRAAHRGAHLRAFVLQAADQLQHLVGGDAAADDDQDLPAGKGHAANVAPKPLPQRLPRQRRQARSPRARPGPSARSAPPRGRFLPPSADRGARRAPPSGRAPG